MTVQHFIDCLNRNGINSYYGVPDSLLKSICAYITDNTDVVHNIIAANEGNAMGMACGHYLATGRPAMVYMQNSGQGNVVNPLLSLMDEDVYSVPVLMLIGWRGEPGVHDEPQHVKQGKITIQLLETMGICYAVLADDEKTASEQIDEACAYMVRNKRPYAIVVRKNVFENYKLQNQRITDASLSREDAISIVASSLAKDDIVISTTGQISRELYEFRTRTQASHQSDFLTVGAMGHSSSIALGVALNKPGRRVICLDGDGAFLMHMGATAVIGNMQLANFRHIVLNNAAHDSVGGQPTVADTVDIKQVVRACGYNHYFKAETGPELTACISKFLQTPGTSMLEIKVKCGARADLGRPKESPKANKESFMSFVEEPKTIIAGGALVKLQELIDTKGWKDVLIFTTEGRIKAYSEALASLRETCNVSFYTDIEPNPTEEGVNQALARNIAQPDAIIALGGGSVIDFAKLYRTCRDNSLVLSSYFIDKTPIINTTPLVAIPTTAGTGSETTRFAVVYIRGEKYSLDAAAVMPDYALVDSTLMLSAPQYVKASCGMDAFAQAIEGYWAKGATAESDSYALRSIKLCIEALTGFVTTDKVCYADKMAEAANLAGRCINIARTTAAHALSYKITQLYGISHGHAVALSLPALAEMHWNKASEGSHLKNKLNQLCLLLGVQGSEILTYFHSLYETIGLEYNLEKLGVDDVQKIVDGCNLERLSNNPVQLCPEDLILLFNNNISV